jgi:hypothetical protein
MTGKMDADDELRNALRRVEPPAGFAERVLRRAADRRAPPFATRRGPMSRVPGGPMARWARWATAAALAVAVTGAVWYRAEQRREAQGEDARRQVLIGLRIASSTLQQVEAKVNQRRAR